MTKLSVLWNLTVILGALLAPGESFPLVAELRSLDELDAPVCDNVYPGSIIACYLINNASLSVLDEAFADAAASNWTEAHLLLVGCSVDDFPDDSLANLEVDLVSLSFNVNCSMNGIPNRLLANVASSLNELQFMGVDTIYSISSQDFVNLPFDVNLEVLVIQLGHLTTIEKGSPFKSFVNLKELTITGTAISQVPSDVLYGLDNLLEVTVTDNINVQTLPSQLFVDLALLQDIWLGSNQLRFLEEGALDGLASVKMLSVSQNPFYCNCSLQWFKDWLVEEDLLNSSGAACEYPEAAPFGDLEFCSPTELFPLEESDDEFEYSFESEID